MSTPFSTYASMIIPTAWNYYLTQLAKRADFFKHKQKGMKTMCELMEKLQEAGLAESGRNR